MWIDQFKSEDGYVDENGCHFDDAIAFIQSGIFGHCGCGCPESSLSYLRDIMQILHNRAEKDRTQEHWNEWTDKIFSFFKSEGEMYTVLYLLNRVDIEEHGSAVPGWLTEKGECLLKDLNELLGQTESG